MTSKIFISPGDFGGVGLEVALKALPTLPHGPAYVLYSEQNYFLKHQRRFAPSSAIETLEDVSQNLKAGVYVHFTQEAPPLWFKSAVDHVTKNPLHSAVVTGPLSKASFQSQDHLGHTEYLRKKFPSAPLFMTFFGEVYNCLLLTDHIPLSEVPQKINLELLTQAFKALKPFSQNHKIALLGLNPHAGENGLLGKEDFVHQDFVSKQPKVEGPFPPDGFFLRQQHLNYRYLMANYHDQGLMTFKLLNGFKSAQASLGLPFVRTSVTHGVASDIHFKGLADEESMVYAVKLALKMLQQKQEGAQDHVQ